MNLRKLQFLLFLIVPLVNFGTNFFFPSPFEDDVKVLIQPAGYAFSIWGPIFLGMIFYSWFQMQADRVDSPYLKRATLAGIFAGLASIAFVPISYTDIQWLGFINIIWHLIALIVLFVNLREQIKLEKNHKTPWYYFPTQMYLGWICAATAVSTALALVEAGLNFSIQNQIMITAMIIVVLTVLGFMMSNQKGLIIPLVFVWALIGVIVENGEHDLIRYTSIAGIVILVFSVVRILIKGNRLSY